MLEYLVLGPKAPTISFHLPTQGKNGLHKEQVYILKTIHFKICL